jgi:sarcosine oxidase subunit gamma
MARASMRDATATFAGGVQISVAEPDVWRLQIHRPSAELIRDLGTIIGCELPQRSGRAAAGRLSVIWLAPGEWLLFGQSVPSRPAIAATCAHQLHAYHDVSDEIVEFAIKGPSAATLLNLGCSLDLRHLAFPVGSATRTLFAQITVVLERLDHDAFRMIVDRSYARYAEQWLAETARDPALPGD